MNRKSTTPRTDCNVGNPASVGNEPSEVRSGIMVYNRPSKHGRSTLQYLREIGLPDYTDLDGCGFADISSLTTAILSPEEIQHVRDLERRFTEFTESYNMVAALERNPHKALLKKGAASLNPLTDAELRDLFAWKENLPDAKKIAKQRRKTFFHAECVPILVMIFERAKEHLDTIIKMRAREELRLHKEQVDRYFKNDENFRFQASGELRGLIKRFIYLNDFSFNEWTSCSSGLKPQILGILKID